MRPSKKSTEQASTQQEAEPNIQQAAKEIQDILKKYHLGMQPIIQIFTLQPAPPESPIVAMGHTDNPAFIVPGSDNDPFKDVPPAFLEALTKPGDEIRK